MCVVDRFQKRQAEPEGHAFKNFGGSRHAAQILQETWALSREAKIVTSNCSLLPIMALFGPAQHLSKTERIREFERLRQHITSRLIR